MSFYPKPLADTNVFNNIDYITNAELSNNGTYNNDNPYLDGLVVNVQHKFNNLDNDITALKDDKPNVLYKTGGIMTGQLTVPLIKFNDNTMQTSAFTTDLKQNVENNSLTIEPITTINNEINITNAHIDILRVNSILFQNDINSTIPQTLNYSISDQNQIYLNKTKTDPFETITATDMYTKHKLQFRNATTSSTMGYIGPVGDAMYIGCSDNIPLILNPSSGTIQHYCEKTYFGDNLGSGKLILTNSTPTDKNKISMNGEDQTNAYTDADHTAVSNIILNTNNITTNTNNIAANTTKLNSIDTAGLSRFVFNTNDTQHTKSFDIYGTMGCLDMNMLSSGSIIGASAAGGTNWSITSSTNDDLTISNKVTNKNIVITPSGGAVVVNSQTRIMGPLVVGGNLFANEVSPSKIIFPDLTEMVTAPIIETNKILTSCQINWQMFNRVSQFPHSSSEVSSYLNYSVNIGEYYKTILLTPSGSQLFSSSTGAGKNEWMRGDKRIKLRYEVNTLLTDCQITTLRSKIVVSNNNNDNKDTVYLFGIVGENLYQGMDIKGYVSNHRTVYYSGELDVVMKNGYRIFFSSYWNIQTSTSASGDYACNCKFYITEL